MLKFIKNILQLMISPDNGWDDIKNGGDVSLAFKGMSWTIIVSALSCMLQLFYSDGITFSGQLQYAIVVIVAYWSTFYISEFALSVWLPRINDGIFDPERFKLLTCYAVSLLSLQQFLSGLLPLRFSILDLWPLYIMVIIWRAMKMLEIDVAKTERYLIITALSYILPSQLLMWIFNNYVL
ncbi:MAG: hypothetical protein K2M68_02915 [Muribaculaceae bacterium]|nr:hypothetical protein [Muribaculaceae bacterium]